MNTPEFQIDRENAETVEPSNVVQGNWAAPAVNDVPAVEAPPADMAPPSDLAEQLAHSTAIPAGAGVPAAAPAPELPMPSLHVSFVGNTRKGKQRHGRALIAGMFEIRDVLTLRKVEAAIGEDRGLTDVEALSWKLLAN